MCQIIPEWILFSYGIIFDLIIFLDIKYNIDYYQIRYISNYYKWK